MGEIVQLNFITDKTVLHDEIISKLCRLQYLSVVICVSNKSAMGPSHTISLLKTKVFIYLYVLFNHPLHRSYETRSSATAKSTARPSCLVGVSYFMTFIGRQTTDQQRINHLYETSHETYRIPRNNAK